MNILRSERGLIFGLVLIGLTLLFLFSAMVAILAHNLIVFLILVLIGLTLYPVTASLKNKYAK